MRILVNALSARLGGGQTYLRNILLRVPQKNCRIFVLCPDNFDMDDMPANVQRIDIGINLSNPYRRVLWENLNLGKLIQSLNVKVLFSPGGLLPRFGLSNSISTVVVFQNMLPFDHVQRRRYPRGSRRLREWLLERGLSSAMSGADLVIFISHFAANFIQSKIGPLGGRSLVIPHGINSSFIFDLDNPLPRSVIAPTDEYYLYVSFIDFYKSQIEVVQAFAILRAKGIALGTLVLVGTGYEPYLANLRAEITRLALEEMVLICGNLLQKELPALYQHARLNLFASRTENCPNILMEIMAAGRPALVSHYGPMPEFAGETVYYFDPADPQSLARCWERALLNELEAANLACRAKERVSGWTWDDASRKLWKEILAINR